MTTVSNPFLKRRQTSDDRLLSRMESQIAALDERVERALRIEPDEVLTTDGALTSDETLTTDEIRPPDRVLIWGVPFSCLTLGGTLRHVDQLIASRRPGYFITANLNYNMLTDRHADLAAINENASFIACDGMPMVWYSRLMKRPLPERVAGSELIYALTNWAAVKGYRVFFLGGAPGVAQVAADKLAQRYAGLQVAGVESPPFRPLADGEEAALVGRIRDSRPDIVYAALGQPKGERWLAKYHSQIGAPVCVQIGASLDFVAGGVARAPVWLQRAGLEWCYRMMQEPGRLAGRYFGNARFLAKAVIRDLVRGITANPRRS